MLIFVELPIPSHIRNKKNDKIDIETIVKAVTLIQIEVEQSLYIKVETLSRVRHSPCPPLLKLILSDWHSNAEELSSSKVGNDCLFVRIVHCSKRPR